MKKFYIFSIKWLNGNWKFVKTLASATEEARKILCNKLTEEEYNNLKSIDLINVKKKSKKIVHNNLGEQ